MFALPLLYFPARISKTPPSLETILCVSYPHYQKLQLY